MLMNNAVKTALLLFCLSVVASCATIAGVNEPGEPPESAETTFPYDRYVEGKPNVDMRIEGGFYIWRIGNEWYVRIAKKLNRFRMPPQIGTVVTGRLKVDDGITYDIQRHDFGPLDDARQRMNDISFKFNLRDEFGNDIEGFDFKIRPTGLEYCVILDLKVDDKPRPGIVHLGSYMHIPETLPLKICLRSH
jgi:hypothetical protein